MRRFFSWRGAAVLALALLAGCDAAVTVPETRFEGSARRLAAPAVTVTNSGGYPLISWSALTGATSYSVELVIHETHTNRETTEGTTWTGVYPLGSTTGTSFLDSSNPYTGVNRCSYLNYPWVTRYFYYYRVTATFPDGSAATTVAAPVAQC
jgi:hypothetical protein